MVFWITAAALALATSGFITAALLRGRASIAPPASYDLEVYRIQLKEVDRDLTRGVITQDEAGRLRTEVSRRILAADTQIKAYGADGGQPRRGGILLAAVLTLLVTGGTLAGYASLGASGLPDQPRAGRLAASDAARSQRLDQAEAEARFGAPEQPITPSEDFALLMDKLRAAMAERPDDPQGLRLLARNEASLGHTRAAQRAQQKLIAAQGEASSADDYAFLADLMITSAGGYVSSEAETSLRQALTLNPRQPEARYYLGAYYAQVDRPDAAFRTWEHLLQDSPPDAAWLLPLRAQIEEAAARAGIRYTLPDLDESQQRAGPSTAQIKAAEDMSDTDRQAFIRSMVDGLAARLASEGGPPEDWAQLITALGVLGETDSAATIWAEAKGNFDGQNDALAILRAAAKGAGLDDTAHDRMPDADSATE